MKKLLFVLFLILFSSCSNTIENTPDYKTLYNSSNDKINYNINSNNLSFYKYNNLYSYYNNQTKTYQYSGDLPNNWQEEYYKMFLKSPYDDLVIDKIIEELPNDLADDEKVLYIINFIQNDISYDKEKSELETFYIRYPYETLYDKKGICSDKSLLLAEFLEHMGYDYILLTYEQANHMAVGIKCLDEFSNYDGYCYVETTYNGIISYIPEKLTDKIVLDKNPDKIHITNNTKEFKLIKEIKEETDKQIEKYGEDYIFLDENKKEIYEDIFDLNLEINETDEKVKYYESEFHKLSCSTSSKNYNKCVKIHDKNVKYVNKYNDLIKEYNELIEKFNN